MYSMTKKGGYACCVCWTHVRSQKIQWEINIKVSLLVNEQDCDESVCLMLVRILITVSYGGMGGCEMARHGLERGSSCLLPCVI